MIDWSSSPFPSWRIFSFFLLFVGREAIGWWKVFFLFISSWMGKPRTWHRTDWHPIQSEPSNPWWFFLLFYYEMENKYGKIDYYFIRLAFEMLWSSSAADSRTINKWTIIIIMGLNAWMMIVFIWIDNKRLNDFSFWIKLNRSRIRTITDNIFYVIIKSILCIRLDRKFLMVSVCECWLKRTTTHHTLLIESERKCVKFMNENDFFFFFFHVWSFV